MAYLTIANIQDEGVTAYEAADARVQAAIDMVSRKCEDICHTWFEARTKTFTIDGNGRDRYLLPQPCLSVTSVTMDGVAQSVTTDVALWADPDDSGRFPASYLTHTTGRFTRGTRNLVIVGSFGTVDVTAPATPVIPADLKAALARWVVLSLPLASDEDAAFERRSLTASLHSAGGRTMSRGGQFAPWSGDPDVDRVIRSYCRPRAAIV